MKDEKQKVNAYMHIYLSTLTAHQKQFNKKKGQRGHVDHAAVTEGHNYSRNKGS